MQGCHAEVCQLDAEPLAIALDAGARDVGVELSKVDIEIDAAKVVELTTQYKRHLLEESMRISVMDSAGQVAICVIE